MCVCEGESSKWVEGCLKYERVPDIGWSMQEEASVKRSNLRNGYEAKERSGDPVSSSPITPFCEGEITNNEASRYTSEFAPRGLRKDLTKNPSD